MKTRMSTTVTKALSILNLFLDNTEGLTVTNISNFSGINMSTAVRLCATLEKDQYLKRNSRGIYSIGPQIERLAQTYRQQFNLEEIIRPLLNELRDQTEESASFYVIDGEERICLFREDSRHTIRHVVNEGVRLPLNRGVVGPLLMAFSGAAGSKYDKIRKTGYYEAEGREMFTASVAAPVFNSADSLVGALVVSGPTTRFIPAERRKATKLIIQYTKQLKSYLPPHYKHNYISNAS